MSGIIDPGPFGNVEAIVNAARLGTQPRVIETIGNELIVAVPDNMTVHHINLEAHLPTPARRRGKVNLQTAESFIRYVDGQRGEGTRLYGNVDTLTIAALIDDHIDTGEAANVEPDAAGEAGWGDHRVWLTFRHSPEWQHWLRCDGALMAQEAFAEHVQEGIDDVVAPDAATFLDLCQTFRATVKGQFGASKMLDNGQTQLTWHQEINAQGGTKANVVIPATLTIGVPVFDGDKVAAKVEAHFRYRLNDGVLRLGYKLKRPHLVVARAWDEALGGVEEALALTVLRGTPRREREA